MADVKSVSDWARAQLHDLGVPPSKGAMQILVGWAKAEGGNWNNDARFNPLNTTQPMAGAGNTGSQGNIKQYRDWAQGIKATTRTLRNGRYDHIINALRSGDVDAGIQAISASPWGTGGGLVAQTIRGTSSKLPTTPLAVTSPSGASADTGTATTSSRRLVSPAVNNEAARAALVYSFLSPRKSGSEPKDLLGLVGQAQALKDIPAQYATDTRTTLASGAQSAQSASDPSTASLPAGHSQLLELIHKAPTGPGYAVKNGQVVSGPGVYGAVWDGHADHVHVAAGPKTIVELGKLAQRMGLHVGENPHFGGVAPVHVPGSYHYKGEAIDVSGDPKVMDRYAAAVEHVYGLKR